jgi:hypothetical protein
MRPICEEATMRTMVRATVGSERGIALPTAMVMLVILTALTFAFTTLATTEPLISRNHTMAAQARAFAESGIERAIWVMTNATPAFSAGIAPAPYDGSQLQTVSVNGGFTVRIIDGADPAKTKLVTAIGWAPDSAGQLRGARKIEATIQRFALGTITPPAALAVTGSLQLAGNATISSWSGTTGVVHCGTAPSGGTISTGTTNRTGSAEVRGPDDGTGNEAEDMPSNQPSTSIPSLSLDDLDALRAYAKSRGTYYQGDTNFNSSNPLPADGGVVFVDTTTGNDLTPSTPSNEVGNVTITSNQTWSGWIVAMGDVNISGTVSITGAVYARNDFVFTGNGTIRGAVFTENKLGTIASTVDSSTMGSSQIIYDCPAFQSGGNTVSQQWALKKGTFRETEGK